MRTPLLVLCLWVACFGGPPARVVSQAVGTDELLLAVADPAQIAALSHLSRSEEFSATWKEAAAFPQLRGGDAEDILRFKPDLVLMTSYSRPELVAQVRRTGVKVCYIDRFDTLEDAFASLRLVARAVGHPERAEALIQGCRQRVNALAARLKGTTPARVLAPSTYGYTAGWGTTFQDLCDHAGALNVAAEAGLKGHAPTPAEQVLGWRVEVMVVTGNTCAEGLAPYRGLTPWRLLPAVQQGRCALLPRNLISSVTHHRIEAYERLARQLHPEAFR